MDRIATLKRKLGSLENGQRDLVKLVDSLTRRVQELEETRN